MFKVLWQLHGNSVNVQNMENFFRNKLLHEEDDNQTGMKPMMEGQLVGIELIIASSKNRTAAEEYDHHS